MLPASSAPPPGTCVLDVKTVSHVTPESVPELRALKTGVLALLSLRTYYMLTLFLLAYLAALVMVAARRVVCLRRGLVAL